MAKGKIFTTSMNQDVVKEELSHVKGDGRDISGGGSRGPDTVPSHSPPLLLPRYYKSTGQPIPTGSLVPQGYVNPSSPPEHVPSHRGYHHQPVDPTSPTSVYNARRREGLIASQHGLIHDPNYRKRVAADMRASHTNWRDESTGQERESNRRRIENALRSHAPSFDELVLIVSALDEELLHISSCTKLQYFDSAMDFHRTLASGCTPSR